MLIRLFGLLSLIPFLCSCKVNFTTKRLFKTRDFWLMFVAMMIGTGAGLMYINRSDSVCDSNEFR